MIPYMTLLERKVLSYIQLRKGPKKVSLIGVLQPIRDGVKLVYKEMGRLNQSKNKMFFVTPLFKFFFMIILILLYAPIFPKFGINLGVLFYLCFSSLLVYTILISG